MVDPKGYNQKPEESEWNIYEEPKPDQFIEMDLDSIKEKYRDAVETEIIESNKIKNYLEAQKRLEEINFMKVIGHDPQGITTYMIFGHNYPKTGLDQFRNYINEMIEFINSR